MGRARPAAMTISVGGTDAASDDDDFQHRDRPLTHDVSSRSREIGMKMNYCRFLPSLAVSPVRMRSTSTMQRGSEGVGGPRRRRRGWPAAAFDDCI